MNGSNQKELTFYPWSMSATGDWDDDSGLKELAEFAKGERDANEMAEWLWKPGAYVQNSAVAELLKHGNVRQAAMLVRGIINAHPICEKTLKDQFGNLIDLFTGTNLDRFPSQPSEYPKNVRVTIIQ